VPTVLASVLVSLCLLSNLPAQTASRSAPSFATLSARADAARDTERLDEATALYKQALALRPQWTEGWWSLGTIAYDRNSYADAARAFRKVTVLAPKNGTAFVMLGLSEFELGQDDESLRHIQIGADLGLDKDPQLRNVALYHEGVVQQRKGQFQSARETLEHLCQQEVNSDELIASMGMVLLRMRGKTLPDAGSEDATVVSGVGRAGCFEGQKKFHEAVEVMEGLVAQHLQYPAIHYAFGLILMGASEVTRAGAEFKREIENSPKDVTSYLEIAAAYYKVDSSAGVGFAEQAVRLRPQLPFAQYLLGLLYLDTDNYQGAIPALEVAAKAFPKEAKVFFALGSAYSRAGRRQDAARARAAFERLNKQFPEASGPTY
jgi:tetratricopeptide (TPR) repeat protein